MGPGFGQRACDGSARQRWQAVRSGNTFSLRGADGLCLEVAGQSRADGAAVVLAACTGAAHQQWQIESLRAGDHERLYQAERERIAWLPAPDAAHPLPVTVDGPRAICRWLDPQPLGRRGLRDACSGRTYAGAPATTALRAPLSGPLAGIIHQRGAAVETPRTGCLAPIVPFPFPFPDPCPVPAT